MKKAKVISTHYIDGATGELMYTDISVKIKGKYLNIGDYHWSDNFIVYKGKTYKVKEIDEFIYQ